MRVRLLLAALLALLARSGAAQDESRYVVVELADGTKVPGRVIENECTDDALVVRKIKGDAKATIPWDQIKEQQAHELRVEYGFEVAEAAKGSMLMPGHEIRNKAGVSFKGLWVNEKTARADGVYVLKTSEGERRVPAGDIKTGPDPVEISQLDVYTSKELYERKLGELTASGGGENQSLTAEDHYQLAEYAVLVDALEEAKLNYEKAIELNDPKYTREKLERRLTQVQQLLEQSGARDALKEIQRAIFDCRFEKAGALIVAFKEKYGSNPTLAKAVGDLEEKSQTERKEYFIGLVPGRIRDAVKAAIERRIRDDKELTLNTAQQYAEGERTTEGSATRQAVDAVAAELALTAEEVLGFWDERKKVNTYKGFYRDGTFLVLDNIEDALAKAPKPPKPSQGQSAPKLPAPAKQMTPDEWWKGKIAQHKLGDLRDWLYARWAEKSEMCDVREPKDEPCPTCHGKGYTQSMVTTPQGAVPFFNRCQTCYMAKFERVVRFR